MELTDPIWHNSPYGFVGNMTPPQMSPPHSAQQVYYTLLQNPYDHGPSQYVPRYPLSPPPMVGPISPLLANSPVIGVNTPTSLNAEYLPGQYTAPALERTGPKQPLIVLGGPVDEVETYDRIQTGTPSTEQLSPTDEMSASHRTRSSRRSL
jgi:hypothetical protein